jgi:iron complex outermembrane receptor protein
MAFASLTAAAFAAHAQSAPAPAPAGSAAQANTVGEVVVTAQFRQQNLQVTPLAITAVNAQMLDSRGQTDISKIAAEAPNVSLQAAGGQGSSSLIAFIRGVGQTDFDFASEPGVGVYVDDVYYATLAGSMLDLLDLDRVEILRGPQGTLAGMNSIGGAIKLYSKKPNDTDGGFMEGTYGSLNRIDLRGSANFVVVPDQLMVRFTGVSEHHDGFVQRIDYACSHPGSGLPTNAVGNGCKLGTEGGQAMDEGRFAVRWIPNEKVEVNFAVDATNDQSEAVADTLLQVPPGAPSQGGLTKSGVSLNGVPYDSRFVPYGPHSTDPNHPNNPYMTYANFNDPASGLALPPINHFQGWGASNTIDWKLSDTMSLKSITSYRWYSNEFTEDAGGAPITVEMLDQLLKHYQWTQEVRLNGSVGKLLDYTVGAFYLDESGTLQGRIDLPYVPAFGALPTFVNQAICGHTLCTAPLDFLHGPDLTTAENLAGFAQGAFHATDKLDVTGGLRYSLEDKVYDYQRHNLDGSVPQACLLPPQYGGTTGSFPTPGFSPTDPRNCALYGLNGTSVRFPGPTGEAERLDWRVDADYHFTTDIMGYAQVSTGYKGGGVNARPFFVTQETTFNPETLLAYELGMKSQFFERKLRLNAAVFYNDYNNIVLDLSACPAFSPAPTAPCFMPANVGSAHVSGAEFEAEAHPIAGLEADASASYLNFQYTSITDPSSGVTKGMITPYTPKWKWSLGVQYSYPLASGASITPRLDTSYQSTIFTDPVNVAGFNDIAGYTLLNGHITYSPKDRSWQASLEVSNITNQLYYTTKYTPSNLFEAGTPGMPREWAIKFKKTF